MNLQINGAYFNQAEEAGGQKGSSISQNVPGKSQEIQAGGKKQAEADIYSKTQEPYTSFENEYLQKEEKGQESVQKKEDMCLLIQENLKRLQEVMQPEDFSKLEELGLIPDQEDPSVVVSVYDRIQMELATYCEDYQVTGTISKEVIEKAASNGVMARQIQSHLAEANVPQTQENIENVQQEWEKLQQLEPVRDESKVYMIRQHMEPTVENLYLAQHAAVGTKTANHNITDTQWQELQGQVEQLLQKTGLDVTQENLEDARWLMEQGIELNVTNIHLLQNINQIDIDMSLDVFSQQMAQGMTLGLQAGQVSLAAGAYDTRRVQNAMAVLEKTDESQLENLVSQEKEVNIANLAALQEQTDRGDTRQQEQNQQSTRQAYEQAKSRRILEEIRLEMTMAAGKTMLKAGISIELTSLEEMVDYLKGQETQYCEMLFASVEYEASAQEKDIFTSTIRTVEYLKMSPAQVLGQLEAKAMPTMSQLFTQVSAFFQNSVEEDSTNTDLAKSGYLTKLAAGSYETMETQVRADLGDSIRKAFGNSADSILDELGLELNETNRRAVRILGYNQMEINLESVENVKQVDRQVQNLFANLNPKTTAKLIAEQMNPLEENINVLNDKLEQINEKIGTTDEKYSTYLWKLEKNHQITQEERDAYVGVYRLLRMIEKSDGAVIGAMLQQGSEFTMKNMLTTLRSKKASGLEVKVDESFGEAVSHLAGENSLDEQLRLFEEGADGKVNEGSEKAAGENPSDRQLEQTRQNYYRQLLGEALQQISPEKINRVLGGEDGWNTMADLSLEQFVETMRQETLRTQQEISRHQQQWEEQWQQVQHISEEAVDYVLKNHQKPSVLNLLAASMMMKSKGGIFEGLRDNGMEEEYEKTLELEEHLNSKEELQEAYENIGKGISDSMLRRLERGLDRDVQQTAFKMLEQGISFIRKSASYERYQLPIEIQGETACVRLTVRGDSQEKGKVSIQISTQEAGEIYGEFWLNENKLKGNVFVEDSSWKEYIQQNVSDFSTQIEETGMEISYLQVGREEHIGENLWLQGQAEEQKSVDNKQLFAVAKQFISSVKGWITQKAVQN